MEKGGFRLESLTFIYPARNPATVSCLQVDKGRWWVLPPQTRWQGKLPVSTCCPQF
jgi:hypothetical protein